MSYRDLSVDANRLASLLWRLGVNKGDRVVLYLEKSVFSVVAHIALQIVGAVGVPLNPGFKKAEMIYLLNDAAPTLIVAGSDQKKVIRDIDPRLSILLVDTAKAYQNLEILDGSRDAPPSIEIQADDPALIIYTSGTTGKPKGAVLTHRNLLDDVTKIIKFWKITESDVLCHALPLFHIHGLCFALNTTLIGGARIVMLDTFSPDTVIRILTLKANAYTCSIFMGVPSMYTRMLDLLDDEVVDFSHIRLWASGSAPLAPKDFERIKTVFGKEPVEREGMTETGMNFSNPLKGKRKAGSIGIPLPGVNVRIVDPETLQDLVPGSTGEIWLMGPSITPGYWQKPDETAESFSEGWFRTGDLGWADSDGYYYLTDRRKHILISGGENISPKEVEVVINRCKGVIESSVVGISDELWGEKVVAAVVRKPGSNIGSQEIINFCKQHLHNWKCPKEIMFVSDIPRNTMGKILKEDVKKWFKH